MTLCHVSYAPLQAPRSFTRPPCSAQPPLCSSQALPVCLERYSGILLTPPQVHSVLVAGYETTSNTLSFAVHQLALHPDKAAKLRAEVDAQPHEPDYQMLEGMSYMDAVLRETLRLFPSSPIAIREVAKDTVLGGTARSC